MNHWRARCIERCTPGSEGGCPEKARTRGTSPDSPPCPYEISVSGSTWTALFLGGPGTLSAGSADELRYLIRADYAGRNAAEAAGGAPGMGEGERALRRLVDEGLV